MEDRERILSKVQALYAKASSSEFEEEAHAFRMKADALMTQWQIDQAEIAIAGGKKAHGFEIREFTMPPGLDHHTEYIAYAILNEVAKHCGLKTVPSKGYGYAYAGTGGDLDYAEIIYTNLLAHMAKTIDPKPDPSKSEAENIYALKTAGFKWEKIHRLMYPDVPWERRHGVRYTAVIKKHTEKLNLPRNTVGGAQGQANYREQFARAYVGRLGQRFKELRNETEEIREAGALVLFNKDEALNEFIWDLFPDRRPHPKDCDCDRCHRCSDPKCQRPRCVMGRMPLSRVPRGRFRTMTYNSAANAAGSRAANQADLGQSRVGQRKALD